MSQRFSHRIALIMGVLSLLGISANQHLQTSADKGSKDFRIVISDKVIMTNLEAPGTRIIKYRNGTIKELRFAVTTTQYLITFHPVKSRGKEQVHTLRQYSMLENSLLPDGEWVSFALTGTLLTRQNWNKGELHGKQEVYTDEGFLIEERFYEEGYPVGKWSQYYEDQVIATTIEFPETAALWKETHPSKGIRVTGNRTANTLLSLPFRRHLSATEVWYSSTGRKQKERKYTISAETDGTITMNPSGKECIFYSNGTIKSNHRVVNGTGTSVHYHKSETGVFKEIVHWTGGNVIYRTLTK